MLQQLKIFYNAMLDKMQTSEHVFIEHCINKLEAGGKLDFRDTERIIKILIKYA